MKESVPLVSARRLDDSSCQYIDDACREWGIFRIVGHGIEIELMHRVLREAELFFAMPRQRKHYIRRSADNAWGYHDRERTGDVEDWKEVYDVGPTARKGPMAGTKPRWPPGMHAFRRAMEAYISANRKLSRRLINVIGYNLGLPRDALWQYFRRGSTSFLRLNYHPHCARVVAKAAASAVDASTINTSAFHTSSRTRAEAARMIHVSGDVPVLDATEPPAYGCSTFGIGEHTDAGALTVLLQDESSCLQVLKDGYWLPVDPIPGSLVVILGDMVRVWSNDACPAPVHRVLASRTRDQHSVAYCFNASYDTDYAPLIGEPRFAPVNWGTFRALRSAHDYDGRGEDARIARYRLG